MELFARVAEAEKVAIEDEALRMIARAAEGSVRDGLSLLDQAIAYGEREREGGRRPAPCSASPTAAASSISSMR